jgi:hypothetical protein
MPVLYEIKPCPFCGNYPAVEDHEIDEEGFCAVCHSCDFAIWGGTLNALLMKWNKRTESK